MGICVRTRVVLLKFKGVKYCSVFGTIYKQEGNDERAFYNDSKLEYLRILTGKKTSPKKTSALTKSTDMNISVVSKSYQPFVRGS